MECTFAQSSSVGSDSTYSTPDLSSNNSMQRKDRKKSFIGRSIKKKSLHGIKSLSLKLPQDRLSGKRGIIHESKSNKKLSTSKLTPTEQSIPSQTVEPLAKINDEINTLRRFMKEKDWKGVTESLIKLKNLDSSDVFSKHIKKGENFLTLGIVNKAPLRILQQLLHTICPNKNSSEAKKEIILAKDDAICDPTLHTACSTGSSIHVIEWLLSIGEKEAVFQTNDFGFTPLHIACSCGSSLEIIEKIIEASGGYDIILNMNENCQTPLHEACSRSNASITIVKKLICLGGGNEYIRMENIDGRNALHLSYMNGAPVDVVNYLLKVGGKDILFETDKQGLNHLQLACMNGASNDIVKRFAAFGGRELVLGSDKTCKNPLLIACANNGITIDVIKEFVAMGGKDIVHLQNEWKENILHLLCSNELVSVDVVRYLGYIGRGFGLISAFNKDGYNVLHLACMNHSGNLELLQVLVELCGKDIILKKDRNNGYNALHILARNQPTLETARFLLTIGGIDSLIAEDDKGNNPLHLACTFLGNKLADVYVQMSNLKVISAVNSNNMTPLDILLQKRDKKSLELVLSIQKKWFELDKYANKVPTITNANLLSWARQLNDIELLKALDYGLLKSIMNKNFIQPINIALLMTDLYIQIATAVVYSFLIHPTITGDTNSEGGTRNLLLLCFVWSAFREFNELFRMKSLYQLESKNYATLLQLVLIMWTIMLFDGGSVTQTERIMYTLATGVSCLQLLIDFGNLSYPIAVFIIALIKVRKQDIAFVPNLFSSNLTFLSFCGRFSGFSYLS